MRAAFRFGFGVGLLGFGGFGFGVGVPGRFQEGDGLLGGTDIWEEMCM
jgi:hypothetical protein